MYEIFTQFEGGLHSCQGHLWAWLKKTNVTDLQGIHQIVPPITLQPAPRKWSIIEHYTSFWTDFAHFCEQLFKKRAAPAERDSHILQAVVYIMCVRL